MSPEMFVAKWPDIPRIPPQHPLQLLGRYPAPEASPRVLLGSPDLVTPWGVAQDIAANWTEGRRVSELPECWDERNNRLKYRGQVFREWLDAADGAQPGIDRPNIRTTQSLLKAARVRLLAPPEYDDLPWSLYAELPASVAITFSLGLLVAAMVSREEVGERGRWTRPGQAVVGQDAVWLTRWAPVVRSDLVAALER